MQLTRQDITAAAENVGMGADTYFIRESHNSSRKGPTGAGVDLTDTNKLLPFVSSLAVVLTEQGRSGDALELASHTRMNSMGFGVAIDWPGVQLTA